MYRKYLFIIISLQQKYASHDTIPLKQCIHFKYTHSTWPTQQIFNTARLFPKQYFFYLKTLKELAKTNERFEVLALGSYIEQHLSTSTVQCTYNTVVTHKSKRPPKGKYLRCTWALATLAFTLTRVIGQNLASLDEWRIYSRTTNKTRMRYKFLILIFFYKKLIRLPVFFSIAIISWNCHRTVL